MKLMITISPCFRQAEHEAVAGQYEVNFGFTDALNMADRHLFMKMLIKVLQSNRINSRSSSIKEVTHVYSILPL